jgi:hypothetical protein
MDARLVFVTNEDRHEYLKRGVSEQFLVSRVYIHDDEPATTEFLGVRGCTDDAMHLATIKGVGTATYLEIEIVPIQ